MTLPPLKTDEALTVVVVDDASERDVARILQQLVKTPHSPLDVVLMTRRSHRLPPSVARRVRVVRSSPGAELETAISHEVARRTTVLVMSAACTVSTSWPEEVFARAALFPHHASCIGSSEKLGLLLYPSAVTSASENTAPWLSAQTLRSSTSAQRPGERRADATVGAVMIVKNEEDVLDECLTALAPFVDEIVVYDTGSSDTTIDIARSHGATVVEGHWDDHFGNARNRALDHATKEWVFQVDADEVVTGDPAEFRARLAAEERDHISVSIVSSAWQGVETGTVTHPVRIFRRTSSRYVGALHEHPAPLDESRPGHTGIDAPVKLMHSGYNLGKVQERSKSARNVTIARKELESALPDDPSRTSLLSNLARSLMWDGQFDEAAKVFTELRSTKGNPSAMVIAGRNAFDFMVSSGRHDDAEAWLGTLASHGEVAGNLATMRARLQLAQGRGDEAADTIASFRANPDRGRDPWGLTYDQSKMLAFEATMLLGRGELTQGIDCLMEVAQRDPEELNLDLALRALVVSGRPLTDLASVASEALIARSIREASLFHPSGALAWFDALHQVHPKDRRMVVAGCLFAARASWTQALAWSLRARELDLEGICALRGLGENTTMPAMERAMAWLVLAEVLGEADAPAQLRHVVSQLNPEDRIALAELAEQNGLDGNPLRIEGPRQVWLTTEPVSSTR